MTLKERISAFILGDCADDSETLSIYSRDTSIFERRPKVVVFPKNADDVAAVVRFVHEARQNGEDISLAPRSAGTDMTGGPLTDSIALVFTKYMNQVRTVGDGFAITEPGVYYRDFEKKTLAKNGMIFPSYPASRELCAMGGIVANNSGGELTLRYGKTNKYINELRVTLSDGTETEMKKLSLAELEVAKKRPGLDGSIYREIHQLVLDNREEIEQARPSVTKNSAGYALWNVLGDNDTFDLSQLIVGSQGTLGVITEANLKLVKPKSNRAMLVMFLSDLQILPEIVHRVMKLAPESFESYDDQTFNLAVRFMPQIIGHLGFVKMISLGIAFIPDAITVLMGGVPKLILMAEFAEDSASDALEKARDARAALRDLAVRTKIAKSEVESHKYWAMRRESFSLLRKNLRGRFAAPFIDDLVVHVEDYPTFLPELQKLVSGHSFIYTIAGHIGDGNFHIIPLVDMSSPLARQEIMDLMPKVYELVVRFKGSITGEHNDGIIRTPYLPLMFSPKMIELFARVKEIFDPLGVLNPGKKTGGTIGDITKNMLTHV